MNDSNESERKTMVTASIETKEEFGRLENRSPIIYAESSGVCGFTNGRGQWDCSCPPRSCPMCTPKGEETTVPDIIILPLPSAP